MGSDVTQVKTDTMVPLAARIWNCRLGGKDYFAPPENLATLGGVAGR